jgi:hypothetical protein
MFVRIGKKGEMRSCEQKKTKNGKRNVEMNETVAWHVIKLDRKSRV